MLGPKDNCQNKSLLERVLNIETVVFSWVYILCTFERKHRRGARKSMEILISATWKSLKRRRGNFPGDHLVELELELEELEELEELADLVGSKMLTFSNP